VIEFTAVVSDIRLESRTGLAGIWQMSLDPTQFRVGDSGVLEAETRSGTRLEIPVSAVVEDSDGVLWCIVEKPLAAGTEVIARVHARLEVAAAS
jgi:hypothetical protein